MDVVDRVDKVDRAPERMVLVRLRTSGQVVKVGASAAAKLVVDRVAEEVRETAAVAPGKRR